ncbi:hypothetical protein SEA_SPARKLEGODDESS_29 [Streptomyces phage SparkleGoddess]|uniref:Uncharacterized protein n=2 Tax=Gilsonvirus comrade TaxID=2846395 RepID=A0A345MDW3_9CAUD|nr:hypothetical protein SEA_SPARKLEGODDESS_29 [Streptomyces phage SparkleGoddess]QQO39715.1 hypothetical protein SEA_BELFORT_30 [Streptomyces phage Belfort]UTN92285.1 hypothetical protein SEA_STIGMA_29 [Streptomyces phage Stigma]
MSFNTLKKEDLLKIAEDYGVDVKPSDNKAVIVAALSEDGVLWEDVAKMDQTVAEQDAIIKEEEAVTVAEEKAKLPKALLKMIRANGTYEIRGYTFKREHPFALVAEDDAEFIVENDPEGFRYATPKEAQAFYG